MLTNAAGEPNCLALVVHDATEWASAEERFERIFNANPAPAVICRLDDLCYVKVNQGFLDMTGHVHEDVLGRSVYEVDVLEQAERRELAIERLGEGATIPQMEAVPKLADGSTKAMVVAGQPIDMNDEACMLFTFMDLEPRKQAERALRQSEERSATAFQMAPVPTAIVTAVARRERRVRRDDGPSAGRPARQIRGGDRAVGRTRRVAAHRRPAGARRQRAQRRCADPHA